MHVWRAIFWENCNMCNIQTDAGSTYLESKTSKQTDASNMHAEQRTALTGFYCETRKNKMSNTDDDLTNDAQSDCDKCIFNEKIIGKKDQSSLPADDRQRWANWVTIEIIEGRKSEIRENWSCSK